MQISRQQLYERVWQTPMRTLAQQFDISDVGLAKACRKHAIPTPLAGHWMKVQHGKPVHRPALTGVPDELVVLDARAHRIAAASSAGTAVETVNVSVHLRSTTESLAPVAAATFAALANRKPDAHGFVTCGSSQAVRCNLSAQTVSRAALLLDAVECALPQVGARLAHERESQRVALWVNEVRLGLTLSEDYRRTETVAKDPKYSYYSRREYHYEFTGALRLTIEGDYPGRKTWADGRRHRLEGKLDSFVRGVAEAALAVTQLRQQREALAQERRRQHELWQAAEENRRHRQAFADNLAKEAKAWRQFVDVRDYLNQLQQQIAGRPLSQASVQWMAWATDLVAQMDPVSLRASLLCEGIATEPWLGPFGKTIV
jgi:hypothetical protein